MNEILAQLVPWSNSPPLITHSQVLVNMEPNRTQYPTALQPMDYMESMDCMELDQTRSENSHLKEEHDLNNNYEVDRNANGDSKEDIDGTVSTQRLCQERGVSHDYTTAPGCSVNQVSLNGERRGRNILIERNQLVSFSSNFFYGLCT